MEDINIYIGWDSREVEAFDVCRASLGNDYNVTPLKVRDLESKGIYYRDKDPKSSTEFAFTRFLAPHLNNYSGWALFCDCDFLWLEPAKNLLRSIDDSKAVLVVKHNYIPPNDFKMDGQVQYRYPRKNWSSLVLWNCSHPANKKLDVNLVNTESGMYLHRFSWLEDSLIGELSLEWNWLVGWHKSPEDGIPKALHFTEGGPWLDNYRDCEYSDVWREYKEKIENDNQ